MKIFNTIVRTKMANSFQDLPAINNEIGLELGTAAMSNLINICQDIFE